RLGVLVAQLAERAPHRGERRALLGAGRRCLAQAEGDQGQRERGGPHSCAMQMVENPPAPSVLTPTAPCANCVSSILARVLPSMVGVSVGPRARRASVCGASALARSPSASRVALPATTRSSFQ